jgi:RNA polymerase sigma factor (sigma-70 family)
MMMMRDEGLWPMDERDWLAQQFEEQRGHLRGVAYRMLGSLSEADDAVQEAWLRLSRTDASGVQNLGGWLTTVVGRVCLDMLRARKTRREESLDARVSEPLADRARQTGRVGGPTGGSDPEQEALLADSVGLALLVVLETLEPAERLAYVLHDMFAVPFAEIAPLVGRTPMAARQLASRARRRVHGLGGEGGTGERGKVRGAATPLNADLRRQREVVDAFLAAARGGDFAALLAVLDPQVVLRNDRALVARGQPSEIRGAAELARRAGVGGAGGARAAQAALVNGGVGVVVAPRGRLLMVLQLTIAEGKIVAIDAIADPERLDQLDLAVLPD